MSPQWVTHWFKRPLYRSYKLTPWKLRSARGPVHLVEFFNTLRIIGPSKAWRHFEDPIYPYYTASGPPFHWRVLPILRVKEIPSNPDKSLGRFELPWTWWSKSPVSTGPPSKSSRCPSKSTWSLMAWLFHGWFLPNLHMDVSENSGGTVVVPLNHPF